jgi:hypothetical protein
MVSIPAVASLMDLLHRGVQLLRRSGTLVNELLEYASWSTLVTICAEGELATEGGANALTHELCQ